MRDPSSPMDGRREEGRAGLLIKSPPPLFPSLPCHGPHCRHCFFPLAPWLILHGEGEGGESWCQWPPGEGREGSGSPPSLPCRGGLGADGRRGPNRWGGSVLGRCCVIGVYIVVSKHSWRAADVFGSSLGEVYCSCFRKMVGGWQCWDQPSCSREGSVGGERS